MAKTHRVSDSHLSYRSLSLADVNADERRAYGIAATEAPVLMPDFERMEMVPEVLLMSGARFDESVPLLKDHQRSTDTTVGSAILTKRGRELDAEMRFSKAESVTDTWIKVEERHVRSLSVGYKPEKKQYVPDGSEQVIAGRSFQGPVNVVTSWKVRELSVTPIGADEMAKMRGFQENPFTEEEKVKLSSITRALLESRGLPKDQTDEQIATWLQGRGMPQDLGERSVDDWVGDNLDKFPEIQVRIAQAADTIRAEVDADAIAERAVASALEAMEKKDEARRRAEEERREEIRSICELARMPYLANEYIGDSERTLKEIREDIKERQAQSEQNLSPFGGHVSFGESHVDKGMAVARTALFNRCFQEMPLQERRGFDGNVKAGGTLEELRKEYVGDEAPGWEDFRYASVLDLARFCLELRGVQTRKYAPSQIAMHALGFERDSGIRSDPAFHTTASFANLTLDAMNKSMRMGYDEFPYTWRNVCRIAPPAKDFKTLHRIQMGEVQNLKLWPDNLPPEETAITDQKVSYAVEAYSQEISFSWQLLVNDDMDALSRAPQLLGQAAARTQNSVFWALVVSNPTMDYDSVALFSDVSGSRLQDNTTTGTLTVANMALAKALMRRMKGLNTKQGNASPSIINVTPRYLVVPATIETTMDQLLNSTYDPLANTNQVYNPFRTLIGIPEPLLDDSSTAIWYLFADPRQLAAIEMTFLQGQETPMTREWMDNKTMARHYMIVQSYAPKAVDHRGVIRSTGS